MCTVVCRHEPDESIPHVRMLALRDEFVSRDFDEPARWWPETPDAVGGRDRRAGGSWCVSDVRTGVTALLVNRIERFVGTPSRGLLPLAAVTHGESWTEHVDHREMASFNLVLASPGRLVVWVWDAVALARHDLPAGTHMITSSGIDADNPKTERFAPLFGTPGAWADGHPWQHVVTGCSPSSEPSALVLRHEGETERTRPCSASSSPPHPATCRWSTRARRGSPVPGAANAGRRPERPSSVRRAERPIRDVRPCAARLPLQS